MLKLPTQKVSLAVSAGVIFLLLAGSGFLALRWTDWVEDYRTQQTSQGELEETESTVLPLANLSAEQRAAQLQEIASSPRASLERHRARYLLASDLLNQQQGEQALSHLENLENEYTILAPQILLKRAQALVSLNQQAEADRVIATLKETYPDSPVIAEVLAWQSQEQPELVNRLLSEFPTHPATLEIARQRIAENPRQFQFLRVLAVGDPDAPRMNEIRNRLVTEYASQLTPEDWEAIAFGYWSTWDYAKAARAYANAPATPRNLYRAGRGLHLSGDRSGARAAYQRLANTFPEAQETGLGLRHFGSLSSGQEAIAAFDRVIANFPQEAAQALLAKANALDAMNSPTAATQARETLLRDYADSDAAVEYRWSTAQRLAENGQLTQAAEWIEPVIAQNTTSELTAKAGFWAGKWATRAGENSKAQSIFEKVLANHTESYYAWRSAVYLGWDVGDFDTVRSKVPQVNKPPLRPLPTAGSESLQELYRLGQNEAAFALWQSEFTNAFDPSVEEQFTDGLIRQGIGRNLRGIHQIWMLRHRETSEDIAQWQELREQPEYWQALYPFPFATQIFHWSQQNQVNPLLVTSLIRQESRFEIEIESFAGARGLMQIMPATGQWVASQLNLSDYSLDNPENNIQMGTWYLHHTHQQHNNNSMLAIASYNAGSGNVAQWLRRFQVSDPDEFVEQIPFAETKGYVESVFGNYWNYLRLYDPTVAQKLSALQ